MSWGKLLRRDLWMMAPVLLPMLVGYYGAGLWLRFAFPQLIAADFGFFLVFGVNMIVAMPCMMMSLGRFKTLWPWSYPISEVSETEHEWLKLLNQKAGQIGLIKFSLLQTNLPGPFATCVIHSSSSVLISSRLLRLLSPEELGSVVLSELSRLVPASAPRAGKGTKALYATLLGFWLIGGGVAMALIGLSGSTHNLTWMGLGAVIFLAAWGGMRLLKRKIPFTSPDPDREAISLGVDPHTLLRALIKTGFENRELKPDSPPDFRSHQWPQVRRLRRLADCVGMPAEELGDLYRSLAGAESQAAKT